MSEMSGLSNKNVRFLYHFCTNVHSKVFVGWKSLSYRLHAYAINIYLHLILSIITGDAINRAMIKNKPQMLKSGISKSSSAIKGITKMQDIIGPAIANIADNIRQSFAVDSLNNFDS